MQNETILLSDLLNGLVELNAVGDNLSPQHFEPPQSAFDLYAVNGSISEVMPMSAYLSSPQIGSTTFGKLQQSEMAFRHEMQRADSEVSTKAQVTGTAIHSFIEAWAAGISVEQYLANLLIVPNFSRASLDGVAAEILYYEALLGVEYGMPQKIADRKELANELRASCEQRFNFVSAADAEAIRGVANELQRRHDETNLFSWLQFAKPEVSFFYDRYKCRPDLLCDGLIVSIKTCARIDRAVQDATYQYGLKEAFYRYIIEQVTGKPQRTAMLFFETVAPYQSRLLFVSDETAEKYDNELAALLEKAEQCLTTNKYRGYGAGLEYGCEII